MPRVSTVSAENVSCKILLFRAIVLAVTYTTAVLTNLVLIVSKSAVQGSKFAKLVALMVVLPFGS